MSVAVTGPLQAVYSSDEMRDIFMASFGHVVSNMSEDDSVKVLQFVALLTGKINSYLLLTPDNVGELQQHVFGDAVIRDFVLSLKFVFFSRWVQGRGMPLLNALLADLALGVAYDYGYFGLKELEEAGTLAIPPQVKEQLSLYDEAVEVLELNPWIVCLLLIQQNINLDQFQTQLDKSGGVK